ncbi:MAG TPA: uridine kinase [Vitreimonas sp.]|uniref:uridine kinase family protein n=1 Tax=Vitreimonas sp. TaxID=3069702 RepID=UPI002D64A23C|nr:uridine kinase [Vitreimonas sp.]HYD87204.1 uridine kinase [Vitreimonas sp.]
MTTLIAITGGSGAGKTTIARALARQLGAGAVVIAEDDYYRCASTIPGFDAATCNFDAPEAKDHALLREHLTLAKGGQPFDKPLYDLVTHRRRPQTERITHADTVIVEGLHLLVPPELRTLFDLKVYVEADEAVRLARRMIRDIESRGRTPRSVVAQFFDTVRPMHDAYITPQRAFADLVLDSPYDAGPAHAEANAARIIEALR